jgi:hypothetical protein
MLDGVNGIAHYQCSQLLGERYHGSRRGLELTTTADWLRANW